MNKDLYKILGVSRNATAKEIKSSYRKLAREFHPDRNTSKEAEQKFKEITAAYAVLSDEKKKAQYDRYGINGLRDGFNPHMQGNMGGFGDLDDLLGGIFGGFGGRGNPFGGRGNPFGNMGGNPFGRAPKGADIEVPLVISLEQSLLGGSVYVAHLGKNITLPSHIYDQQKIRIAGKGKQGPGGNGDLFLVASIKIESPFSKWNDDLLLALPVTITQAIKGAKVMVLLPENDAKNITLPAGTQGGQRLRLKGKGLPCKGKRRSDLYVQVQIRLPSLQSPELDQALEIIEQHYSETD